MHDPAVEALRALDRPGMGTESAGPFLRSLVRLLRPRNLLEVGAGASTLHILLGLRDACEEAAADRDIVNGDSASPGRESVLHPGSALAPYTPTLRIVDDLSVAGTSAGEVLEHAEALGLTHLLSFVERDFFELTDDELDSWGPLDLVWLDAGTQADDARFLSALWHRTAPEATVVLHEPYLATTVESTACAQGAPRTSAQVVPSPLLQELRRQADSPDRAFDVMALGEPHKVRQTGVMLLRKRGSWERDRGTPFQEEIRALGESGTAEVPRLGRDTQPPAGPPPGPAQPSRPGPGAEVVAALADDTRRTVYGAVLVQPGTTRQLAERTGLAASRCAKALAALKQAALVEKADAENWTASTEVWRGIAATPATARSQRQTIPTKQGKRRVFLQGLVTRFEPERRYPEPEVNRLLHDVDPDVAALRRYMIEEGLLHRADGVYWRA